MKKILLLVALLISFGAFAQHDSHSIPEQKTSAPSRTKVIYTCIMHPQVQKSKPGNCPICGMELVKKTIKVAAPKTSSAQNQNARANKYVSTYQPQDSVSIKGRTHPTEDSDAQIDSVQKNGNEGGGQMVDKVIYTCVMHPEVQQDGPGKCPKCGMTLVKKTIRVSAKTPSDQNAVNMQGMEMRPSKDSQKEGVDPYNQIPSVVSIVPGKTVRYDLYVKDTVVNYTGKSKHAIAINGSIPGPTLYFSEGDTAAIYLHNELKEETSLHWHGVVLPNPADGVPYLTTAPIHPGETHLYKFKVVQNGTYWYHSHNGLQEQIAVHVAS